MQTKTVSRGKPQPRTHCIKRNSIGVPVAFAPTAPIYQRSLCQVGGVRPGAGTKRRNKRANKFGFANWPALLAHVMGKAGGDPGLFRRMLASYL